MDKRSQWRDVRVWSALIAGAIAVGCQGRDSDEGGRDGGSDADGVLGGGDVRATEGVAASDQGTGASSASDVDATSAGSATGAACSAGGECASGWCVPSALGTVCVDLCVSACPDGYRCMPAASEATDPVYVCVATTPNPPGSDVADADDADAQGTDGSGTAPTGDGGPSDDGQAWLDGTNGADGSADASETTVPPADLDGDGVLDDVDHLPCLAVMLIVYNSHVTSASLSLNGSEIVSASEFPTTEAITRYLNVVEGENDLDVGGQLTGSPGDSLTLVVTDTNGHVYFETVIVRQSGPPKEHSYRFVVDAHCD